MHILLGLVNTFRFFSGGRQTVNDLKSVSRNGMFCTSENIAQTLSRYVIPLPGDSGERRVSIWKGFAL
jgi:hypothetical protein